MQPPVTAAGAPAGNHGPPGFREALLFWLKLGFISFGGPAGQIAIMHEYLVEKKGWIAGSRFMHALNYCMLLPGPEAQQLATYLGWLLHGVRGGVAAGLLFILPAAVLLLGLSAAYVTWGSLPVVAAMLQGLKGTVVAIVLVALIRIGQKALRGFWQAGAALLSFAALYFGALPFPLIILLALAAGFIRVLIRRSARSAESRVVVGETEAGAVAGAMPIPDQPSLKKTLYMLLWGGFLWAGPVIILSVWDSSFAFWFSLVSFFTKTALVTFGGAYAVLPYVATESVETFSWLSSSQMIDGMALGESTPGPLIMILVFVGFMAGYNAFGTMAAGALGLALTAYYTFLPSFLFILIGAPWVERSFRHEWIKDVLSVVTAAVTGVILSLAIYLGVRVAVADGSVNVPVLVWIVVSFVVLYTRKAGMLWWIAISCAAGLAHAWLRSVV